MGIMVYSSLWVMQDLYHQPYDTLTILGSEIATYLDSPGAGAPKFSGRAARSETNDGSILQYIMM